MKSEEGVDAELERERLQQEFASSGGIVAPDGATSVATRFMIAGEAPVLMGKASELMIKDITTRAWRHTERNRRRTLQKQDIHSGVGESDVYDFLIDIVPRGLTQAMPKVEGAIGTAAALPSGAMPGNGENAGQTAMSLSQAESRYAQLQQMQQQLQSQFGMAQLGQEHMIAAHYMDGSVQQMQQNWADPHSGSADDSES